MEFFSEGGKGKEKGTSIFLDVFRRADKNDDDCLSWDEFRSFFADGVLSEDELRSLFHEIDTHKTNNIDTGELCTYFSKQLGPFKDIFCALEDLNRSVSKALVASAQEYPKSAFVEQFVTRFLMREILNQLTAIQRPLDEAADSLEESALADSSPGENKEGKCAATVIDPRFGKAPLEIEAELVGDVIASAITPGRLARRARKQLSTQTSWTVESGAAGPLMQQVDRMRSLLDRMENRVNFDGITDEDLNVEKDNLMLIVHRKFLINEGSFKAFRSSVRSYVETAESEDGCLHVSVRSYAGSNCFTMYEIWNSDDQWKTFLKSKPCRAFQHSNVDNLEVPEQVNTLKVPSTWWKRD